MAKSKIKRKRKSSTKKKLKSNISKILNSEPHKKREGESTLIHLLEKTTNRQARKKIKTLATVLLIGVGIWLVSNVLFSASGFNIVNWAQDLSYVGPLTEFVKQQIVTQNPFGVYFVFSFSSLFFLPMPLELFYITFLGQGSLPEILFPMTLLGILTAQHINYGLGRFMGNIMQKLIRKKTYDKVCSRLHKSGGYGIFVFHLFPLPYAILNFVVGVTKYPYHKWLILMIPALMINYFILTILFKLIF